MSGFICSASGNWWQQYLRYSYTPELMAAPTGLTGLPFMAGAKINLSLLVTIVYIVCYLILDPIVGGVGSAMMISMYILSGRLVTSVATLAGHPLWQVLLAYHVFLWILQFIGHGVFEK